MKIIKRNSFESPILYRGVSYKMLTGLDVAKTYRLKEAEGFKCLIVEIKLSKNLKGGTDLYGNEYKPNQFLFIADK